MISSLPPAVFGLKLWNTTISTTATTTQSIRFLTRSFIQLRSAATPQPYLICASLPCASAYTSGERLREAAGLRITTRSEEHPSELQSLMRNSYAVFCLKKKKKQRTK